MSAINIESGAMQAIVAKAVLEGIGDEQRDLVLQQAVNYLLKPEKISGAYGRSEEGPSPLQAAINQAMSAAISKIARELVDENEALQTRIRELMEEAVRSLLDSDNSTLVQDVRQAVGNVVSDYRPNRYS